MNTHETHLMTGSSTVLCGAPMRDDQHPEGWDLGTVTVNRTKVTCAGCKPCPVQRHAHDCDCARRPGYWRIDPACTRSAS